MSGNDSISRRQFVQVLGAGLMVAVAAPSLEAQEAPGGRRRQGGGGGGGGFRGNNKPIPISARVHIGADGTITIMTGKVECGQGSRAEITQAAAEELRVTADAVQLIMADTGLVPDDGMTAGSGTTPRTVPTVRHGAAAAREALLAIAAKLWSVDAKELEAKDGKVLYPSANKAATYGALAAADGAAEALAKLISTEVTLTSVKEWKVMGVPTPRPNRRDLVTGKHHYPSDVQRPGMLYGKILRPPAYGAKLKSIDLSAAKAMPGVVAVQEGDFVGFAAPTRHEAQQALAAAAKSAQWEGGGSPVTHDNLYDHLSKTARGGIPANPFADQMSKAAKTLKQQYHVAYIQHAPMEPRAAVAEWDGDNKLTVWCGTQNPFGIKGELAQALKLDPADVRVIVPDFGGGFGGKHRDVGAVEAARLAKAAGKPVSLRWTRQEEFTWAYFRPAGVIVAEASLDADNKLTSWHFINVNSGPSAVETPYQSGKANCRSINADGPLKPGSYRGLASTANVFARECFIDELAAAANADPLAFRVSHLPQGDRLRAVLELAAEKFGWADRRKQKRPDNVGVGLACGTEKGAFTAACAEVEVNREKGTVRVRRVVQAFECGAIVNPAGLTLQVQGAIVQGLGAILREEIRFADGKVQSDTFGEYKVPRFADVPQIEVHLLDRQDLPSSGAGETPIVAVAPAVANAVFDAIGQRVRSMPMRVGKA